MLRDRSAEGIGGLSHLGWVAVGPAGPEEAFHAVFSAPRNDMDVQMRDALADFVVDRDKGTLGAETGFNGPGDQLRVREQRLQHRRWDIHQSFDMLPRAYETMAGEQGSAVQEHNTVLVFVYFLGSYLTADNFAEYAVVVRH